MSALACVASCASAFAADTPTLDANRAPSTKLVGHFYMFDAGQVLQCPATITAGCDVTTTVSALVHPTATTARVVDVATGKATVAAGTTVRVTAKLNAAGVKELKLRGRLWGNVDIEASGTATPTTSAARFVGQQTINIPPMVIGDQTKLKGVKLAPGQRLQLKLNGESASTGYHWSTDKPIKTAALKLISSTTTPDPSCAKGAVGCFSIRSFVYIPVKAGTTALETGLFPPQAETDATVLIDLKVTTVAAMPAPKMVTYADNGKMIKLAKGQDLVADLDGESGSTGYSWSPLNLSATDALKLAASTVIEETCVPLVPGCPSQREVTFIQRHSGTSTISISLFGPASTKATKTLTLRVTAP